MNVLLINPNTTAAMTARLLDTARAGFGDRMRIEAVTAGRGVAVVASRASYAVAAQSVLECWAAWRRPVDAVVVACFGDPGVAALRELAPVPVYGLAQSTLRAAAADPRGYAVVTAGPAWPAMLDELVAGWGLGGSYRGTRAIDATGLGAANQPDLFRAKMQDAIDAVAAAGAGTVVLGGAALAGAAGDYASGARLLDCLQATLDEVGRGGAARAAPAGGRPRIDSQGLAPELARLLAGG